MPRGGVRPGAGRPTAKKLVKKAVIRAPKALPGDDLDDPAYLLALVARGETKLPTGKSITPDMVRAAKELLPYHKAKIASISANTDRDRPKREYSTDELEAMLAEVEAQLAAGEAGHPDGASAPPESPGELSGLVRALSGPDGAETGPASPSDDLGTGESSLWGDPEIDAFLAAGEC
jgi:hypothetical protein